MGAIACNSKDCERPSKAIIDKLACPGGVSSPVIEPLGAGYGERRWAVSCKDGKGVRTGKYIESEGKSIVMEGQFAEGKKSGVLIAAWARKIFQSIIENNRRNHPG